MNQQETYKLHEPAEAVSTNINSLSPFPVGELGRHSLSPNIPHSPYPPKRTVSPHNLPYIRTHFQIWGEMGRDFLNKFSPSVTWGEVGELGKCWWIAFFVPHPKSCQILPIPLGKLLVDTASEWKKWKKHFFEF